MFFNSSRLIKNEASTLQPHPALLTRKELALFAKQRAKDGLGYFLFARRYSGNSYWFLFHQVLKCFTSLGAHSYDKHMSNAV
jgi:hypothetical protein